HCVYHAIPHLHLSCGFSFTDTAPTETYTLSLHDALPIFEYRTIVEAGIVLQVDDAWLPALWDRIGIEMGLEAFRRRSHLRKASRDRKSTRLNSSHEWISYAVFCLKKKTKKKRIR